MAITIHIYNHTARLMHTGAITYASLKFELVDSNASFVATNTTKAQVDNTGAWEVDGSGWPTGGVAMAAEAISTIDTDGVMLDADDISVSASGGSIGPAPAGFIYDDAHVDKAPLFFVDFGENKDAGVDTEFKVTWDANGIYRLTIAAS